MYFLFHTHYLLLILFFFFFNDTATTEIYTLSLHDALPIFGHECGDLAPESATLDGLVHEDRKSTRLNSSHVSISYAVFCLKKKRLSLLDSLDDRHETASWGYVVDSVTA